MEPDTTIRTNSRFKFYDDGEVTVLPDAEWIVDGIVPADGLVQLYGEAGIGKTILAIGMALSVANDQPWAERAVKSGPVVYIYAEGVSGIKQRVAAWKIKRGLPPTARTVSGVYFLPMAVQLLQASDLKALLEAIDDQLPEAPRLVVIDTLARCMVGGEESSAKDMGLFVAAADRIRHTTGASVLIVHHSGWEGGHERGSTALRGAADTIMRLGRKQGGLVISCDKQKDADPFEDIRCELVETDESCILEVLGVMQAGNKKLSKSLRRCLEILEKEFDPSGATNGELCDQWMESTNGGRSTFQRNFARLRDKGLIEKEGESAGARWSLTDSGREALGSFGMGHKDDTADGEADKSHESHPPIGVRPETEPNAESGQ